MADYKQLYHEAIQRAEEAESRYDDLKYRWDKTLHYAQDEVDEELKLSYPKGAGWYILKFMNELEDRR